jgi:enamine deaminase RidA (YjgF/YER057c/UK114 family)
VAERQARAVFGPLDSDCRSVAPAAMIARMPAQLIRADGLYPGAPYAYASVAPAGGLIFTAGACPIDEDGEVTSPGDYAAQAELVMANLVTALAAAGAGLADVLKSTVYVASARQQDLVDVWEIVHAAFGEHDAPSTLLGVAVLGYSDQLVEIEAIALAGQQAPPATV